MHGPQFEVQQWEGVRLIKASGHIDAVNFADLANVIIRSMLEVTPALVLDCAAVTYIESAQLQHLADLAQAARNRGGNLVCAGMCPAIRTVARLVTAENSLKCCANLAEALYHFSATPTTAVA